MNNTTPGPWKHESGLLTCPVGSLAYLVEDLDVSDEEWHANGDLIASAPDMAAEIERLKAERGELLEVCEEIAKGEGAFSLDPLTFANNTIENMKDIAKAAIAKAGE